MGSCFRGVTPNVARWGMRPPRANASASRRTLPISVTPERNRRTSGIVRSAAAPRSSSPGARRSMARSSVAASRCSVGGDRVVVARRDAVRGQHAVGQRHQREAQLLDLVARRASFCAARANGDPSTSVRRCASAVGTRSAAPFAAPASTVERRRGRLPVADAHAGEVELAVDLERLVVVGEAEVGHAARAASGRPPLPARSPARRSRPTSSRRARSLSAR